MSEKKAPAEILYDDLNINGRMQYVAEMLVFLKTTDGSYFGMASSNASLGLREQAAEMLSEGDL